MVVLCEDVGLYSGSFFNQCVFAGCVWCFVLCLCVCSRLVSVSFSGCFALPPVGSRLTVLKLLMLCKGFSGHFCPRTLTHKNAITLREEERPLPSHFFTNDSLLELASQHKSKL